MIVADPPALLQTQEFSVGEYSLEFDRVHGAWTRFTHRGVLILSGQADFDVRMEGALLQTRRYISSHRTTTSFTLIYELNWEDGYRCMAEQTFRVFDTHLERKLSIRCNDSGPRGQLLSITLSACGLIAGDEKGTLVSMPMTRSLPALPSETVASRNSEFEKDDTGFFFDSTGLDVGLAVTMLSRVEPPFQVNIIPMPDQCPVKVRLHGSEAKLFLSQEFVCESWLDYNESDVSQVRQVFLPSHEPWPEAARAVGMHWHKEKFSPPDNRPHWASEAVILEVDLTYFEGLKKLTTRLDEISDWGFNTIYLMPWHSGHWNGYGTYRYDAINPSYGTFQELRELCDEAHRRGMRVLFDLLINVAGEDSPYPKDHPDWFYRDGTGKILRHPTWNSWCLDPASPDFRKELTDYAVRCCTEWGADGFRVDAAAYRGGNWNNLPGMQPHQHAHAVFTLLEEIRSAIRSYNPEAICLAECFGPAQVPISDLVAYQWVAWLDWMNQSLLSGQMNGAAVSRLLGEHFLAMPGNTWLVGYAHTHDTVAFEKRELDGPAVEAFFATLTFLCAGIMVFGGGWEMRPRPNIEEAARFRRLFGAKRKLGSVASHELFIIDSTDPALLIIERPSRVGQIRVISNFSNSEVSITAHGSVIYNHFGSVSGKLAPFDTMIVLI